MNRPKYVMNRPCPPEGEGRRREGDFFDFVGRTATIRYAPTTLDRDIHSLRSLPVIPQSSRRRRTCPHSDNYIPYIQQGGPRRPPYLLSHPLRSCLCRHTDFPYRHFYPFPAGDIFDRDIFVLILWFLLFLFLPYYSYRR